jgi:hypothetical protein
MRQQKSYFKFKLSRVVIITFANAAIVFLLSLSTHAQDILTDQLFGTWDGTMITEFQGHSSEVHVQMMFQRNQKAILTMTESENATYKISGNSIEIIFDNGQNGPLSLKNVLINKEIMNATAQFSVEPVGISTTIKLSKLNKEIKGTAIVKHCANTNVPERIQILLQKYQLECPLTIRKHETYKAEVIRSFLYELLEDEVTNFGFNVTYHDGVFYIPADKEHRKKFASMVKLVFKDPNIIKFKRDPHIPIVIGGCSTCATYILPNGQLNPKLLKDSKPDFIAIWGEVIRAAESVPGIRLDPQTLTAKGFEKKIKSFWRKAGQYEGYDYFEKINIEMTDPYKNTGAEGSGDAVGINVIATIIRRKGFSSDMQSMECLITGNIDGTVVYTCSENPCMNAILNAIKR